jgi:small subunit ribosomal protein S16
MIRSEHTVAVRIRLLRMGKIRNPQYRIVVADSRTKRDGRAIEYVGLYHPKEEPSRIEVNSERVQHWLSVGAQPSEPVIAILSRTGDWQKFKGLPAPAEPLKVAPARADRKAAYEVEAKAAAGIADTEAKAKGSRAAETPKKAGEAPKKAGEAPRKAAKGAAGKATEAAAGKATEAAAGKATEAAAGKAASGKAAESAGQASPAQESVNAGADT